MPIDTSPLQRLYKLSRFLKDRQELSPKGCSINFTRFEVKLFSLSEPELEGILEKLQADEQVLLIHNKPYKFGSSFSTSTVRHLTDRSDCYEVELLPSFDTFFEALDEKHTKAEQEAFAKSGFGRVQRKIEKLGEQADEYRETNRLIREAAANRPIAQTYSL